MAHHHDTSNPPQSVIDIRDYDTEEYSSDSQPSQSSSSRGTPNPRPNVDLRIVPPGSRVQDNSPLSQERSDVLTSSSSRVLKPSQKLRPRIPSIVMPNIPPASHSRNRYDYYGDSIISHIGNPRLSIRRDSLDEQDYYHINSLIGYYEDSETEEEDTDKSSAYHDPRQPPPRPPSFYPNNNHRKGKGRNGSETDPDSFIYSMNLDYESRYRVPSLDSFPNSPGKKNPYDSSTYTSSVFSQDGDNINLAYPHEPKDDSVYASWGLGDRQAPVSKEEIEVIFNELVDKFGFQKQSMRNIFDLLMCMLDSRASRMSPSQALLTIHADYIGGEQANYYKWYFATRMDLDDDESNDSVSDLPSQDNGDLKEQWIRRMNAMSHQDRVRQLALWLLLWGEAAQVRFTSECLCFIFKLADDYTRSPEYMEMDQPVPEGEYLREVVTPLYRYIRDQGYKSFDGGLIKREKDHAETIGYDDINELFWYPERIERIALKDKTSLMTLNKGQRYQKLGQVDWNHAFEKTYKEKRTWLHLAVNFNRVWILHVAIFWYYTAFNATFLYTKKGDTEPAVQLSVVALGGTVATLFMIIGCICEFFFVPLKRDNVSMLVKRLMLLILILIFNTAPTYYIYMKARTGQISLIIGIVQFIISLLTTLTFSITPSSRLFGGLPKNSQKYRAFKTFTANYPELNNRDRATSIGLWLCVFGCKFVESYFFLSLSFKDPLKAMADSRSIECGNKLVSKIICSYLPVITMVFMIIVDLILFFLDTYLWYVIWYTIFSVIRSFYLGISIWTPWKNIYTMLPKRIYAKILDATNIEVRPKILVSQIWNAIVISMYREHFLSIENVQKLLYRKHFLPIENVQKLLYQQSPPEYGKFTLKPPTFFVAHNSDHFFPSMGEAERRISFFSQSLSTPIPDPLPIQNMPTFTVLTPHYSEKVLLSLREIIREKDKSTRVTLLEYLKQLHPEEWDNFVKDTKILIERNNAPVENQFEENPLKEAKEKKMSDLAFYSVGFKSSAPEYTTRTRIWASLRSQTLYRTVSGFMNYSKAIKLLYHVENPEIASVCANDQEKFKEKISSMARSKFKFVVSMQRFNDFNDEERENVEFLLQTYPDLLIAYIDELPAENEGEEPKVFSVLIDGHCELTAEGKRKPKYRIQLPGNPILGDGKSDNQNHAIIFCRGEYLQLVDANQDNYLEECLKIRSILREFEQYDMPTTSPYSPDAERSQKEPVAIVGAREYIFSENYGVLGDVAAAKEQTFGTLTQRIMAQIGGRLHYGHPDFLNAIFMTTRGGISKAQKGLHLNEDIYAGINAFNRGGRIKHAEYYQCGKGRDLGFGSILHFITKIGTGMGEQMLSREYYYLGTQLPLDRFLTFYYAHPGFHVNNIFIMLSVQLFVLGMMFIGVMASTLTLCIYNPDPNAELSPPGCTDLNPVFDWIKRSIVSIVVVFMIAFLPLFLQEFAERGLLRSTIRLGKHMISLSPFFEVFITQIYSHSITTNLSFGGARYIGSGRGVATARIPFSTLYARFTCPSIYFGVRIVLILLFVTMTIQLPHLGYFWLSVVALSMSPFLFNPHQFSFKDFIIDYREFLRWMSRGNSKTHASSWISFCRMSRTMITGYKRRRSGHPSEKSINDISRPSFVVIFTSEILFPFISAALCVLAFAFVKTYPSTNADKSKDGISAILRVCGISFMPVLLNAVMLAALFFISFFIGPIINQCFTKFGSMIAAIAHAWSVLNLIVVFELLWFINAWNFSDAVLGVIALVAIQRFIFKLLIVLFLTREFKHDETNRAWWTGKWYGRGLGCSSFTQPFREYICKIVEMSLFATDFILGHIILFILAPICLIPWIDRCHSTMLFWLKTSNRIRDPIFSQKQKRRRKRMIWTYGILFLIMYLMFIGLIAGPIVVGSKLKFQLKLPI
ncbi:1488_t:CDS:2 [Acaulospora morrowiae]|uniref:1,3-beta-glucan synthase n=1 Tax=Acaulospora morrowiae TaxID=94023 RepID=A0A9N9AU60_9GLOM|nr:1488_t:CDS:2 [Acaulospora morrowiae]